jgi:hypothetical protein
MQHSCIFIESCETARWKIRKLAATRDQQALCIMWRAVIEYPLIHTRLDELPSTRGA